MTLEHSRFKSNDYTTRFIDDTPELFKVSRRRDRARKLLNYLADVTVNGHPEVKDRLAPSTRARVLENPIAMATAPVQPGTRGLFVKLGPERFAKWMREERRVLITDTTMRDAHQSLLATRMRTVDIAGLAPAYAEGLPGLLSLECWGGATFDVAMRFLHEDPSFHP
jgi:pyruvate carboxylase